jgi:ATP-binding cassette, subfamily C, bacterial
MTLPDTHDTDNTAFLERAGEQIKKMWGTTELFRLFGDVSPYRLFALLILILLSSLTEGLGILLLVPLIALLSGNFEVTTSLPEPAVSAAIASPALLLAGFAGLIITRALLQQWQQIEASKLQRKIVEELRLSTMRAILHAEWRWLSAQRTSENSTLLLSDLTRVGWGIGYIPTLASAAISIMIYLAVSFALSWPATLLALCFGIAAYAAAARYRRRIVALGEAIGASNNLFHQQIDESLAGAKLIKSFSQEEARIKSLGGALAELESQQRQVMANASTARVLIDTASALFLAILTYGALFWFDIPGERLVPLIIIFARFVPLIAGAQQGLLHWLNAVPALRRVTKAIDDAGEHAEPMASGLAVRFAKKISVERASFAYSGSDIPALANISLSIPARCTTAITGPSGVGKSTLADLLGGLIEPDTGQFRVDEIAIKGATRTKWRQSVAYVHQDAFFFDGSIADNLRIAKHCASDEDIRNVLAQVGARFVDSLRSGLKTRMGNSGKRFSGGERQRLALARALLASPELLILDEATSALDRVTESAVIAAIEALRGKATILVISHRPIPGLTIDHHVELKPSYPTAGYSVSKT